MSNTYQALICISTGHTCGKVVVLPPHWLKLRLSSRPQEVPLCVNRWLGVDMLGTDPWRSERKRNITLRNTPGHQAAVRYLASTRSAPPPHVTYRNVAVICMVELTVEDREVLRDRRLDGQLR